MNDKNMQFDSLPRPPPEICEARGETLIMGPNYQLLTNVFGWARGVDPSCPLIGIALLFPRLRLLRHNDLSQFEPLNP